MRKSIAIAAALVASAGATAVGASSVPTSYFGSDTLFVVTQDALTNASISSPSFYLAGGSGAGQGAMAAALLKTATQQTAPMSKMMTNGVCNALGGTNGNAATGANGIVIGMDGVDVLASVLSGGLSACTTAGSGAAQSGDGLVYSGSTGVFSGSTTNQNWKWALALLYGGLDLSTPSTLADCGSPAAQEPRQQLDQPVPDRRHLHDGRQDCQRRRLQRHHPQERGRRDEHAALARVPS